MIDDKLRKHIRNCSRDFKTNPHPTSPPGSRDILAGAGFIRNETREEAFRTDLRVKQAPRQKRPITLSTQPWKDTE